MSFREFAPDPRRTYTWWRGAWWTESAGQWWTYAEVQSECAVTWYGRLCNNLQQVWHPRAGGPVEGWYLWHSGRIHLQTDLDAVPPFTDEEWHTMRCDLRKNTSSMHRLGARVRSGRIAGLAARAAVGGLQGQTSSHLYTYTSLPCV